MKKKLKISLTTSMSIMRKGKVPLKAIKTENKLKKHSNSDYGLSGEAHSYGIDFEKLMLSS
jgi:hypothetical protein